MEKIQIAINRDIKKTSNGKKYNHQQTKKAMLESIANTTISFENEQEMQVFKKLFTVFCSLTSGFLIALVVIRKFFAGYSVDETAGNLVKLANVINESQKVNKEWTATMLKLKLQGITAEMLEKK